MAAGPKFAVAVTDTGLQLFGLGALVLAALVLPILVMGLLAYRMPSGSCQRTERTSASP